MFSIGQFSLITRLPVKTLRYYHEEGLLVPDYIDEDSGYRYYREGSAERAMLIGMFREMDFSIADIKEIFSQFKDDGELLESLSAHRERVDAVMRRYKSIGASLDHLITRIRSNEMKEHDIQFSIQEKDLEDIIFAGTRFKGKYSDVGRVFGEAGKKIGRYIAGRPMTLYHDGEYKETDADIEGGFPVRKSVKAGGIESRVLRGCRAVTLVHRGSYESLGMSYKKIMSYIDEKKYKISLPTREVYLKGPGIIFRGNPEKYLTEIQIPVA